MNYRLLILATLFGCFVAADCPIAQADSWLPPPTEKIYESASQDARLTVVVSGKKADSLFRSRGLLQLKDSAAESGWRTRWNEPLQNPLSPLAVLVSDGGWRVVTLDNYYTVGFGDEVVVFYDENGKLLKKHSLEMLLAEKDLARIPRTVSSRWWRKKAWIDESLGLLKIEIAYNPSTEQTDISNSTLTFQLLDGSIVSPTR